MNEATEQPQGSGDLEKLNRNLQRLEELSQRLVTALSRRRVSDPGLHAPGHDVYAKAAAAYMAEMITNPSKVIEHQISYWGKTLKLFAEAQRALASGELRAPPPVVEAKDRRFASPLWDQHPFFNLLKQQYLINAEAIENAVRDVEGLDPAEKRRVEFFARQILDLFSPANFLGTNPEALQKAIETDGESLVRGLENLVRDIEANEGDLLVTLADKDAFRVGDNLATTPGEVVFRNRMFELIQYRPATEKVRRTPLLFFPPWINKFYILDLKPANSMVKWLVEQGFTVFMTSWVNPDASYADVGLDTYIEEGFLTAIDQVKRLTGEDRINAVGYCIGGTTLALTSALLQKRGDKSLRSATFFTTLTDFTDPGEMAVFIQDDFIEGIEREVARKGYLHAFFMSRTFSYLRAKDLVYQPAIRSYMMGEAPPAFDLLYWNSDGTNLPGRFVVEYLRQLCQDNLFARGEFEILGERIGIRDVKLPVMAIACQTDHIAEWKASFNGVKQFGSRDKSFILSESGHIAGIVNPPSKKKYGHYTGSPPKGDPLEWLAEATHNEGSWWPRWAEWLGRRSGAMIPAREPVESLGPAPGTYVLMQPKS